MENNLIFDVERDVSLEYFVYTLKQKPKVVYKYSSRTNMVNEKIVDNKSFRIKLKIPKKKIVVDGWDSIDYDKALLIYKPSFIEKHTLVIEDKDKFETTHNDAYKLLYVEYEKYLEDQNILKKL